MFLIFFIGIRFLVKPDTSRENTVDKGENLDLEGHSHIIIHPTIILERWNVLLICIVVATAASLISAQFANRVKNRTVGLVTGAVLTVLGAATLILNYWPILSERFQS